MPLEIAYRPVLLPAAEATSRTVSPAWPELRAHGFAELRARDFPELRARDFNARIRRRDTVSLRGALHRSARLRQRFASVALVGMLPVLLAVLGWGDPRGITGAAAQSRLDAPSGQTETDFRHLPRGSDWDRTLADVHSDGDIAKPLVAGPSARPLLIAGSGLDRWRALECLTAAIYYEAAREPDQGQRAVAQVVLNRVAHPAFPKTVCGVVYQGSERSGCQFSFACDGSLARRPMAQWWDRARRVAQVALAGDVYAPIGLATHYHTSAVHPAWADSMAFLGTIGAHRFYRWSGGAGQPHAFSAVYAGGEPVAAPHPHTWVSTDADLADPLVLEKAFEAGRLAALRNAIATTGQPPEPALRNPAAFGQQSLNVVTSPVTPPPTTAQGGHPAPTPDPVARILPGSGAVRPDAVQQFDSASHWIHQPGA